MLEPQFLGYVIQTGGVSIYHSGDTILYEGMAERLRSFHLNVALLPINGAKPERRVAGNLSGVEAARLADDAAVTCVVPCHYDMFEFNTASPDEFVSEARGLQQKFKVLQAGERMTVK